jgi:hypothetical protein
MAETDILNPVRAWWPAINDNPNPSYGFTRRANQNTVLAKARMGSPYSRDTMSDGFAFMMTYVDRPWTTVLRLKRFYEQHKGGYFTYIDWDGGGRHHVGRFTSPVNAAETGNNKYTVQELLFEEMPRARMVEYPADFVNWSRQINVVDDFLAPAAAWYSYTNPTWALQIDPSLVGPSSSDPSAYELFSATPTVGDWAQIEYVGWGFQINFRQNVALGNVLVYVDDVVTISIDLSNGSQVAIPGIGMALPAGVTLAGGLLTSPQMPLDTHRVKIVTNGAVTGKTAIGAIFPRVTVIT